MHRRLVFPLLTLACAAAFGTFACTEAVKPPTQTPGDGGADGEAAAPEGDANLDPDAGDASDAARAPSEAGTALERACDDLAFAQCDRNEACAPGFTNVLRYASAEECARRVALACLTTYALVPDAVGASAAAAACATAIGGADCDALAADRLPAACAVKGEEKPGAPCVDGAQCDTGYCSAGSASGCGQCAPAPTDGTPCSTSDDCAGRGLASLVCAGGVCVRTGALGKHCDATFPCGAGLSCVAPDGGAATCKAAAALGERCDRARATAPDCLAGRGLYCNPTGVCAKQALESVGRLCGLVDRVPTACLGGGQCVLGDASSEGRCVGRALEGEACDPVAGPPCLAPARCELYPNPGTGGRCALPSPAACR